MPHLEEYEAESEFKRKRGRAAGFWVVSQFEIARGALGMTFRNLARAFFVRFAYISGPIHRRGFAMPAPFPAKAVANAILEKAFAEKQPVTPLKLQKLLYYAHGYYSGAYGKPLIDQPFEAWQYGPVAPSIYHEFKGFGNAPITRLAEEFDWDAEDNVPVVADFDEDTNVRRVINWVWKQYAKFPATALSEMTHRDGSPWDKTMKSNKFGLKNPDISQDVIQDHFARLAKRQAA